MRSRVTQLMLKVHTMLFITFLLLHTFFLIWDLEIYRNSIVNMIKLSDSVFCNFMGYTRTCIKHTCKLHREYLMLVILFYTFTVLAHKKSLVNLNFIGSTEVIMYYTTTRTTFVLVLITFDFEHCAVQYTFTSTCM